MRPHQRAACLGLFSLLLAGCKPDPDPVDDSGVEEPPPWEAYWGEAPDVDTRLAVFDELWEDHLHHSAALMGTDVDWLAVRDEVRPQVEAAGSYGEFFRLLSHLRDETRDVHDVLVSEAVCGTPRAERPPVVHSTVIPRGPSAVPLGACVTATAEHTSLVYKVMPGNPADLRPGDELLGYDGVPWAELLDTVMEMPWCGARAAHPAADRYQQVVTVALNPQLFGTLDVRRAASGAVESIPTDGLLDFDARALICDERPAGPIAPPWSEWRDYSFDESPVAWGLLPDTNVGYITAYAWVGGADIDFLAAVQDLYDADGLIVDFRFNMGGSLSLPWDGFRVLFREDITGVLGVATRADPDDPRAMDLAYEYYDVVVDHSTGFDGPIAVLTGPAAVSAGDDVALYLASHPRARRFGLPTNGSGCNNAEGVFWAPDPYLQDLTVTRTPCLVVDRDGDPIAWGAVEPEEEVWLLPADVAAGRDTVLERALQWVQSGGPQG